MKKSNNQFEKYHLENITKGPPRPQLISHQTLSNLIKYCQISSNIIKQHQTLSVSLTVKSYQTLSNIVKSCLTRKEEERQEMKVG